TPYVDGGQVYGEIKPAGWARHQRIDKPSNPKVPVPNEDSYLTLFPREGSRGSRRGSRGLDGGSPLPGRGPPGSGREGKGGEGDVVDPGEQAPPTAPPKPPRRVGSRSPKPETPLPEDWKPEPETFRSTAERHGFGRDRILEELDRFRNKA